MARELHQVGTVLADVDREVWIQLDRWGMLAQQPCADRVEGAGPDQGLAGDA